MGMFDTFYFNKPIPCAFCNAPIESVQSKEFMNILHNYYIGDRVDGSTVTGIVKTDLFCSNYAGHSDRSKEQYIYIVVWHHLYIGIASTESEAESMLNKFGMGEMYLLLDTVQEDRAKLRSNLIGLRNIIFEYGEFLNLPPERQELIRSGKKDGQEDKDALFELVMFSSIKKYLSDKNPLKAIADDKEFK